MFLLYQRTFNIFQLFGIISQALVSKELVVVVVQHRHGIDSS